MRIILLIAVLTNSLSVYGQLDLHKKIDIEFYNAGIEEVLSWLQDNQNIRVSYGFDNIPADIRVTINAKNISVYEIIKTICQQGNLVFQVIDNTVVFKAQKSHPHAIKRDEDPARAEKKVDQNDTQGNAIILDTLAKVDSIREQQNIGTDSSFLAETFEVEQLIVKSSEPQHVEKSSSSSSQKFRRRVTIQTGIFFSYASDFNQFGFAERDIAFQTYNPDWNESYSLGGYIVLSRKLYISIGATYVTKDFHLTYNFKVIDPNDPFPIPDKTHVKSEYLEVPLTFGYAVKSWEKYSVLVATGLYPSFLLKERENTTYLNQGNPDTKYFLDANQSTLFSASVGFIVHRYVNRTCGIFIEPGYLYFFSPVNEQAMNSHSSLFRLKAGIQFTLSGKI